MMRSAEIITKKMVVIAKDAGAFILKARKGFSAKDIQKKGKRNLVSFVDIEAEKMIVKALKQILPDAGFLTEERTVSSDGDYSLKWIIDPLDGTTNFIHGLPVFSVSIALEEDGEIIAGVVYECNLKECFYAWKGGGAYLNDHRINVTTTGHIKEALIATGFPYKAFHSEENFFRTIRYFFKNTRGLRRLGSAATDLAYVACGRFDAFFEYNLNPWDVAAGVLIIQEAGGKVSDLKGENNYIYGRSVAASNGLLHRDFLKIIQE